MPKAAPATGTCGQDLDIALMIADGPSGKADPAYEAHLQPIGMWAKAIWEEWFTGSMLQNAWRQAGERAGKVKEAVVSGSRAGGGGAVNG